MRVAAAAERLRAVAAVAAVAAAVAAALAAARAASRDHHRPLA